MVKPDVCTECSVIIKTRRKRLKSKIYSNNFFINSNMSKSIINSVIMLGHKMFSELIKLKN